MTVDTIDCDVCVPTEDKIEGKGPIQVTKVLFCASGPLLTPNRQRRCLVDEYSHACSWGNIARSLRPTASCLISAKAKVWLLFFFFLKEKVFFVLWFVDCQQVLTSRNRSEPSSSFLRKKHKVHASHSPIQSSLTAVIDDDEWQTEVQVRV